MSTDDIRDAFSRAEKVLGTRDGGDDGWPTPIDLFGETALVGEPELPHGVLPSVIDEFARDEAARLGVDPAMVGLPCLAVAAAAIDDRICIQPKAADTRWRESARIWVGVIAEPGLKKTPALKVAMVPLHKVEHEWIVEDNQALEQFEIDEMVYKAARSEYSKAKSKGKAGADIPTKPERPRLRRKVVADATVEALSGVLADNPGGVLVYRDELSGWFGSFDAYRDRATGKDRAAWLELYNGGRYAIDRIRRGRVIVPNWSICLVGGIQPGPMRRLIGKLHDDGLVQRFIVVHGKIVGDGEDRAPNFPAIHAYENLIAHLAGLVPTEDEAVARLAPEAQRERAMVEKVAARVMTLQTCSPALRAHLSKWSGLFARLVLLFHTVERVSEGRRPGGVVGADTAAQVARLMIDYILPNSVRFYVEILGQFEHIEHTRWIAGMILARRLDKITPRDVYRAYSGLRGDVPGIMQAMETLDIAGWVTAEEAVRGKRPPHWVINPRVHEIFGERADLERQRRERVRAEVAEAHEFFGIAVGGAA